MVFSEHPEAKAYSDHNKRIVSELKGHHLSSNGGADVGAQDDAE